MVPMAKIVHSEAAPAEAVHYSFAGVEFDLSGKKSYESDDPIVLANAAAHPWLSVQYPAVDVVAGAYVEQLAPEADHLSAAGQKVNPNDPEVARAAEEAKRESTDNPVAIDAGETQTKAVETDGVAETLAADDTSKTSSKKGS